jgi:hypothetical protein
MIAAWVVVLVAGLVLTPALLACLVVAALLLAGVELFLRPTIRIAAAGSAIILLPLTAFFYLPIFAMECAPRSRGTDQLRGRYLVIRWGCSQLSRTGRQSENISTEPSLRGRCDIPAKQSIHVDKADMRTIRRAGTISISPFEQSALCGMHILGTPLKHGP